MFGVMRSAVPDLEIPEVSLGRYILDRASKHGDRVALVGITLSWYVCAAQICQCSEQFWLIACLARADTGFLGSG